MNDILVCDGKEQSVKMQDLAFILCYTEEDRKWEQIEALCSRLGCGARRLCAADIERRVGVLAGMKAGELQGVQEKRKAPAVYHQAEILVFVAFSEEKLDLFLRAYRQAGIAPIPLKAVLTPHNCSWSVYELTQELMREHIAMMERRNTDESDRGSR